MKNEEIHVEKEDARAGATPHVVRYMLIVSLVLVVAAFVVIMLWGGK